MGDIGIFLDRDGTINEELEFISDPENVVLIPGSVDAIREANQLGLKVFVITNQSGIARGLIKEEDLVRVHNKLVKLLNAENAHLDAIYFCPHHPDYGEPPYRTLCDCRKPNTGMLKQAEAEFNIDLKKSFIIGDRIIDIQTAHAAGAKSILVLTGYGKNQIEIVKSQNIYVDYIAENLHDAMQFVKKSINNQ
ncbi:MAG: D-glycero-beta-D-manno-heptose 1,7-bisphosphate 7-phosphatase [Bacteroidetes bacterium]|nr:D-glycero-beta-D-manno-heptose 1,7-bisphosphate 7-phosphatase [Bacteroidota bacterium]MBU2472305.1 D-glycero-beta-D-manno-heptose 1,7-bisphosphate 7-phosphatase [Bacteroidota bacterium]MBU2636220.1 D-glycero-beta-D-manno-heptose 1,7-bisphosphate 7-phosphatase [Bacteroidota bacterium]